MRLDGNAPDGTSTTASDYARKLWNENPHCFYCGVFMVRFRGTLDHVVPTSRGGSNTTDNVVLSCKNCNQAKGNRTLDEWLRDLFFAWKRRKGRA